MAPLPLIVRGGVNECKKFAEGDREGDSKYHYKNPKPHPVARSKDDWEKRLQDNGFSSEDFLHEPKFVLTTSKSFQDEEFFHKVNAPSKRVSIVIVEDSSDEDSCRSSPTRT